MTTKTRQIPAEAYHYELPDERIAKFPLPRRDDSKLLLYRGGEIAESTFRHIAAYLPPDALLVFNNTRVIQARLLFQKDTGAEIEIFCLEPAQPHDYALAFRQTERCCWTCLAGNLKKWKEGALQRTLVIRGTPVRLCAERLTAAGGLLQIAFSWDQPAFTFADVLQEAGVLPIPPYLHRDTEEADAETYQTVYSKVMGSVAAPTAGLHFTPEVLADLSAAGFRQEEITLHVGAGTFRPLRHSTLGEHEMHAEHISATRQAIERIRSHAGCIIAVGTTSVRTLESLYCAGVLLSRRHPGAGGGGEIAIPQWMPYEEANSLIPPRQALQHVLDYLDRQGLDRLAFSTQIMIAPGYVFRITGGLVTNFHQPRSTLLALVSAFVKEDWKRIYAYALEHGFRFLSYGDSSLLLPGPA